MSNFAVSVSLKRAGGYFLVKGVSNAFLRSFESRKFQRQRRKSNEIVPVVMYIDMHIHYGLMRGHCMDSYTLLRGLTGVAYSLS